MKRLSAALLLSIFLLSSGFVQTDEHADENQIISNNEEEPDLFSVNDSNIYT